LDSFFLTWQDSYDTALEKVDAFPPIFRLVFPISRHEIVTRFKPFDWMSYANSGWFQESIVATTEVIKLNKFHSVPCIPAYTDDCEGVRTFDE
jgi:hypothetical protein